MNALNSPTSHQYANTLAHFIPHVIRLDQMLDQAIANQDQEALLGLSKIICGLGDNHCRLVLSKINAGGMNIIQTILKISKLPLQYPTEENCSPVSFTFWYSLQDEFEAMTLELQQNWGRLIHGLFFQFIEGLIMKLKLPDLASFTAEEKESYRVYRIDISDALMYVFNLLNQTMLQFMADSVAWKMNQPDYNWREVEAILFCFYSIVESCDTEGDFIQKVATILPRLDMSNEYMAETVIYTVGALAEWLVDNTGFISPLLPLVIPGLEKPELALTSVLTLKRITRECRFNFSPEIAHELNVVMRNSLHGGKLQQQEQLWLIQSIGHVLGAIDAEKCLKELEVLISPYVKQLNDVMNSERQVDKQARVNILHVINLLANLQSTLDRAAPDFDGHIHVQDQRPACLVVQQLTPIFRGLLLKCGPDSELLQAICQFYDKSVRTMVEHGVEVIDDMVELVVKIIGQAPHAAAIDLALQILTIHWQEKPEHCFTLLKTVIETTNKLKEANQLNNNPDIMHSTLELYGTLIRKMSAFLLSMLSLHDPQGHLIVHMAEVANLGLHFHELPVVKSSVGFITELSRQTDERFQATLKQFGQFYVMSLVQGITGNAGRAILDYIGDGLFFISKPNVQNFAFWLNQWLAERRKLPNCKESDIQRNNFVQQLVRERTNKRRFRELCAQFALMARGLHG